MKLEFNTVKKLEKKFHKVWIEYGEPHPNSNKYLALVKSFYYTEGLISGAKIRESVGDLDESDI